MPPKPDLIGQRFGRLIARIEAGKRLGNVLWLCDCDCGNQIAVTTGHLRGLTRSCGCLKREYAGHVGRQTTHKLHHGHAVRSGRSSAYSRWQGMIGRCEDPKHRAFKNYGGRGIKVCQRWRESFQAFLDDMGEPPKGLTLDRIDNDGNYEPGNRRWATRAEQKLNARPRKDRKQPRP